MRFLMALLVFTLPLFALHASDEKQKAKDEVAQLSEAFGHMIGKNIDALGIKVDLTHLVKGLQDAAAGKESPMSEAECIQALAAAQEEAHKKLAQENLEKAEQFLATNEKNAEIVTIEKGKLQYKIESKGNGPKVEAAASPMIRYVGKYLDGSVFGSSQKEETLCLEETIPGFSKGLVGMQEGEKRTLYIHPEYGYGTQGYLAPNSLLVFEIEVVKANTESEKPIDASTTATIDALPHDSQHLTEAAVR